MANRYNTPTKGTLDWHVPLNENFNNLDTDVELRDIDANKGNYTPTAGAKFLATDTGSIYLGDGSSWNQIGTISSSVSGGTTDDGARVAASASDIQTQIDAASTGSAFGQSPTAVVRLVAGQNYTISSTIDLKQGVRLECNGARITPDGDFDVIRLYRDTELIKPHIDTRNMSWSSTQVVVGADDAEKLETNNRAWVQDCYLLGENGQGTGLQFRGGSVGPCSMQKASGNIDGFDRAIDLYASGGDISGGGDWSNGNHFEGNIRNYRVGIAMRSEGAAIGGNSFRIQAQPNPDVSEWLWYMEDDPRSQSERGDNNYTKRGNTVLAKGWDADNYEPNNPYYDSSDRKSPFWYIGEGKAYGNALIDFGGIYGNEYIVNNADTPDRNGILTAHGGDVTGTSVFTREPSYAQNNSRVWHPDSVN